MTTSSKSFTTKLLALPLGLFVAGLTMNCGGSNDGDAKDDTGSEEDKSSKGNEDDSKGDKDSSTAEKDPEPKADGELCEKDEDCENKKCREVSFTNPLTEQTETYKTCAACADDKECADADKGIACVPAPKLVGGAAVVASYQCSDGAKGSICEEVKQCKDGLKCAAINVNGKKSDITACGECESDSDCSGDTPVCSTTGLTELKPYNTCIAAGGKKDGESCSGEGETGDKECENYCKTFLGIASFCVQCLEDSHCKDTEQCGEAQFNPTDPASSKFPQCEPK